ncbi:MAG: WbqC family protein [Burkholderiaceae bacterium]
MMLTDYQYFGNICFIELLFKEKQVCFDSHAPFTKMSFKNRMVILSAQGPLNLTIPIVGGRDQKTAINNIRIAYDAPWQAQHFKALKTCYKRAPYFEYYEADLEKLYTTKTEFLVEFLKACHQFLQKAIKGKWELIQFKEYAENIKLIENISKDDKEANLNRNHKILHPWQPNNYEQFPIQHEYQQVFTSPSGFIQNLSILDKLFCVGGKEISKQLSEHLKKLE